MTGRILLAAAFRAGGLPLWESLPALAAWAAGRHLVPVLAQRAGRRRRTRLARSGPVVPVLASTVTGPAEHRVGVPPAADPSGPGWAQDRRSA